MKNEKMKKGTKVINVENDHQQLNLILFLKYTNKCYYMENISFYQYNNNILIDYNGIKFFLIDLNNNWKSIKKSIDSKINITINDCNICNDKRTFDRFIFCEKCDGELCLTCSILLTKSSDGFVFKCPYCRHYSNIFSDFLNQLEMVNKNTSERINLSCNCSCGRITDPGETSCSRCMH